MVLYPVHSVPIIVVVLLAIPPPAAAIAACTNAVVATCVVLVPAAAVGAVKAPEKDPVVAETDPPDRFVEVPAEAA